MDDTKFNMYEKYMNDYDRDKLEAECIKKEYDALGIPATIINDINGYTCVVSKEAYTFDGVLLQKNDVIYFKKDFHKCFDSIEFNIKDHNHLNYYGEPFVVEEVKKVDENYVVTARKMHGETSCVFEIHDCSVIKSSPWAKYDDLCFFIKKDLPWHLLRAVAVFFLISILAGIMAIPFAFDFTIIENFLKEFGFSRENINDTLNMCSTGFKILFPSICLFLSVKILFKVIKSLLKK